MLTIFRRGILSPSSGPTSLPLASYPGPGVPPLLQSHAPSHAPGSQFSVRSNKNISPIIKPQVNIGHKPTLNMTNKGQVNMSNKGLVSTKVLGHVPPPHWLQTAGKDLTGQSRRGGAAAKWSQVSCPTL